MDDSDLYAPEFVGEDGPWIGPGPFYAPIQPWDLMEPMEPFPSFPEEDWEFEGLPVEIVIDMLLVVVDFCGVPSTIKRMPTPRCPPTCCMGWWRGSLVGWSQPPRPADVVVSFDPRTSKKD